MKCMVRLIKYITNKNWTTYEILAFSARILIINNNFRNKIFLHFKEYNNIYIYILNLFSFTLKDICMCFSASLKILFECAC